MDQPSCPSWHMRCTTGRHPMKTIAKPLGSASLFSFLALGSLVTGCASSPSTPAGDDGGDTGGSDNGGGGGGGRGGRGGTSRPPGASGQHRWTSTYDVATNMPGTVGTIVNDFIAATDDPNDPTQ